MKILLSWSGEGSRAVAEALREWLPLLFQTAQPWMSAADLQPGSRWGMELARQLNDTDFGILCLTKENLSAPWILFEAGALSKSLAEGRVVPYLHGLLPHQVRGPLSQFQCVVADEIGTLAMVRSIATASAPNQRTSVDTDTVFLKWWPELQSRLSIAPRPKAESTSESRPTATLDQSRLGQRVAELVHNLENFHSNPEGIYYIGNTLIRCEALFEELGISGERMELIASLMREIDDDERKHNGVFDPVVSLGKISRLRSVLRGLQEGAVEGG